MVDTWDLVYNGHVRDKNDAWLVWGTWYTMVTFVIKMVHGWCGGPGIQWSQS